MKNLIKLKLNFDFFENPIREKIQSNMNSILEEIKEIGNHENKISIWLIQNIIKNAVSLCPNNLITQKTICLYPLLDNDLVEFTLKIPPNMKKTRKIYYKMLKKLFPQIMKIPSNNDIFTYINPLHLYVPISQSSIKESKRYLFPFLLRTIRFLII